MWSTTRQRNQTVHGSGQAHPATQAGYEQLLAWLRSFGEVERIGVEGTGSYGFGLSQHLRQSGIRLVEVNRPNRQARRRHGKSDEADAEAAARATLARDAVGTPKSQDGSVEVIRILRIERRSAIQARTQAANQLHAVVSTAPVSLRVDLRGLRLALLIACVSKYRRTVPRVPVAATRLVLRGLADRWLQLDCEVDALDHHPTASSRSVVRRSLRGVTGRCFVRSPTPPPPQPGRQPRRESGTLGGGECQGRCRMRVHAARLAVSVKVDAG